MVLSEMYCKAQGNSLKCYSYTLLLISMVYSCNNYTGILKGPYIYIIFFRQSLIVLYTMEGGREGGYTFLHHELFGK